MDRLGPDIFSTLRMKGQVLHCARAHLKFRVDHFNQSINQSTLFNEGDTQQCPTDKLVAVEFPIELEFRNVGF